LDLAYLAAIAEAKGAIARIEDYPARRAGWDDLQGELRDYQPSLVVISVTTPTLQGDMRAAAMAKEMGALIIAKGAHFLTEAETVLRKYPALDIAIRGEYEQTFAEIIMGVELAEIAGITYREDGEIIANEPRPFLDDLDKIPFPARHLLDNDLYRRPDTDERQTTIQTNRGCPSQCLYCLAGPVSGRHLRLRSPENIVAEIEECVNRHGIRNFFFRADTFTMDREWVLSVCRSIKEKRLAVAWVCNSRVDTIDEGRLRLMKEAGCWLVALGIEAGTAESLEQMRKGITLEQARTAVRLCRQVGLKSFCFYMIGLPWEDEAAVRATADFAIELDGDFTEFHIAVPFPGTELYRIVSEEQLWEKTATGEYDHARSALRTRYLSAEQLEKMRRQALLRFYLRPKYIWRTLRQAGPRQWKNYLRFGWGTLRRLLFSAA